MNLTYSPSPSTEVLSTFEMEFDAIVCNQYYFPHDECDFLMTIFAIDAATNNSVPIIDFSLNGSGGGDFSVVYLNQTVGARFIYDAGGGPTVEWVQSYVVEVAIVHSLGARAITYSMFTINWILTLCSIITTSLVFSRRGEVKDGVTLLPITVILTIPIIRALYVGSPPYGIHLGEHRKSCHSPSKN